MGRDARKCSGLLGSARAGELWPARSRDVGTSRAPVVARSVVRRPWKACAAFLVQNWQRRGCFLVSYKTLAAALGQVLGQAQTSAELLDFGAASLTVNS